jgi:hypothetical protein
MSIEIFTFVVLMEPFSGFVVVAREEKGYCLEGFCDETWWVDRAA